MTKIKYGVLFGLLWSAFFSATTHAAIQTATSCSTSAVQAAINAASNGDTVVIPNGSCTWTSGISTSKQIWIRAQNYTSTDGGTSSHNVTITNNSTSAPLFELTSGNNFHVAISGIRFNEGSGDQNHVRLEGTGSKVPLISDCYFEVKNRFGNQPDIAVIAWLSLGGVMWNTWVQGVGSGIGGQCCPEGASIIISSPRAWETASTMGSLDSGGSVNVYFEDVTLKDFGQSPDVDDRGRLVMRYSLLDGISGLTHGFTSAKGGRHVEYYNDTFTSTTSNRNIAARYFWLRAGTALFTDNVVNTQNQGYGTPVLLDIGDNTSPSGYPQARQPGWGHNGSSSVIDPIYVWNQSGSGAYSWDVSNGWGSNVVQGREIFVNNGAKPGYSKYTYPHPLRTVLGGGGPTPPDDTTAPSSPTNLSATVASASQVNLSWTASTDNVGVAGYRVERCQGGSCSNFAQIAAPSGASYSDAGLVANTTYRYRVRATDAAANLSGYSNIASGVTPPPPSDTTPPSNPGNLSGMAVSSSQINLSWTASTDNIGVTGYRVERCQGGSCSNFAQIATPSGASYSNTGLAANSTYRFRVRATDLVGNLSGYSSITNVTTQSGGTAPGPLPSGNSGISALYPGDSNIQSHPDVLFTDNFESYSSVGQLTNNWNQSFQQQYTRIATESGNVFAGNRALEFRVPQQSAEVANAVIKTVSPAEDTMFVRVYTKFEAGYNVIGSNHNGIGIQAQYCCAGVPADGTNKFYVDVENSRDLTSEATPGLTHVYIYHPEQRSEWGDHWYPDGRVVPFDLTPGDFGPDFIPRANFTPALNRWYSYELMVKANTPGQRDGRIAVWIDGNLVADFLNVRLRDVSSLKIDQLVLGLHIGSNTTRQNMKWYDNVVVARSYIGPMSLASIGPQPPTSLQLSVN